MASRFKKRFVTTKGVWEWNAKRGLYVRVSKQGYWYQGPWAEAHPRNPVWAATNFRFYDDTGFPGTGLALENIAVTATEGVLPGDSIQLRMDHGETGAADNANTGTFTLQVDVDGGGFNNVTTTVTDDVFLFNSSNLTDGTGITTQLLLGIAGSGFASGFGEQDEDNSFTSQTWSDDFGESHFALQFNSGLTGGEVFTFRWLDPASVALAPANSPVITLDTAAGDVLQSQVWM